MWEAAVGTFTEETFNSITTDQSFDNNGSVNVGDFTISATGSAFNTGVNNIDASPFRVEGSLDVNGSTYVAGEVRSDTNTDINVTFNSPTTAFGATFNNVNNLFTATLLSADSESVSLISNGDGFFGFVADGSFSTVSISRSSGGVLTDAFGADDFVYASSPSTPVPFEVSPTLGLLTIGGIFGINYLRKKKAAIKNNK